MLQTTCKPGARLLMLHSGRSEGEVSLEMPRLQSVSIFTWKYKWELERTPSHDEERNKTVAQDKHIPSIG